MWTLTEAAPELEHEGVQVCSKRAGKKKKIENHKLQK